ncbi:helix-turn-helix domain-containing protein [Raoultibacter phocaeensis]|uniref:helix-turn-helix domain-containing protein n=1 Tax=Raoultibacter phocaeensis TaxID=2479841 RepID=UPI00111A5124|nr:helix-turn-helix domain-containing protein [Raoultibacter phocaeensis]
MITTKEAAERLGISTRRVVALIQAGDLEAQKLGRSWIVDESSVALRASEPKLKGRPKLGQKNLMSLKRYTLMNRNHEVLDFVYDNESKRVSIGSLHDGIAWVPLGLGREGCKPNAFDFAVWLTRRYMPPLRQGTAVLMQAAGVSAPDELMFGSLGLNLSDQYWFRPENASIDWHEVNFFENEYCYDPETPLRTPDSSTPGALPKRWKRIEGVDYLVKGSSGNDQREPYNELLATELMHRLLDPSEYVPYRMEELDGRVFSLCPTMATSETEFVPAHDVAVFAGITKGRNFYTGYIEACERFGIRDARTSMAKMIVCDHVMANFDRHRGNFGLMRTVETLDGWRIAPLFDNGAGFFSRATRAEIAGKRFTWTSHPFSEYPSQQLAFVEDISWYDPAMLEGFSDTVATVLGMNAALSEEFAHHAARHVQRNIDAIDDLAAERAAVYRGM